jgi:hypothetical protein
MFSHGDAAIHVLSARAAASRANGAKSKGPRTAEGKARASRNALRHGMCAKKFLLLPYDSRAEFAALESALLEELRPQGALETLLARRLIAAAWRLARADRLEFEMLVEGALSQRRPGRVFPYSQGAAGTGAGRQGRGVERRRRSGQASAPAGGAAGRRSVTARFSTRAERNRTAAIRADARHERVAKRTRAHGNRSPMRRRSDAKRTRAPCAHPA